MTTDTIGKSEAATRHNDDEIHPALKKKKFRSQLSAPKNHNNSQDLDFFIDLPEPKSRSKKKHISKRPAGSVRPKFTQEAVQDFADDSDEESNEDNTPVLPDHQPIISLHEESEDSRGTDGDAELDPVAEQAREPLVVPFRQSYSAPLGSGLPELETVYINPSMAAKVGIYLGKLAKLETQFEWLYGNELTLPYYARAVKAIIKKEITDHSEYTRLRYPTDKLHKFREGTKDFLEIAELRKRVQSHINGSLVRINAKLYQDTKQFREDLLKLGGQVMIHKSFTKDSAGNKVVNALIFDRAARVRELCNSWERTRNPASGELDQCLNDPEPRAILGRNRHNDKLAVLTVDRVKARVNVELDYIRHATELRDKLRRLDAKLRAEKRNMRCLSPSQKAPASKQTLLREQGRAIDAVLTNKIRAHITYINEQLANWDVTKNNSDIGDSKAFEKIQKEISKELKEIRDPVKFALVGTRAVKRPTTAPRDHAGFIERNKGVVKVGGTLGYFAAWGLAHYAGAQFGGPLGLGIVFAAFVATTAVGIGGKYLFNRLRKKEEEPVEFETDASTSSEDEDYRSSSEHDNGNDAQPIVAPVENNSQPLVANLVPDNGNNAQPIVAPIGNNNQTPVVKNQLIVGKTYRIPQREFNSGNAANLNLGFNANRKIPIVNNSNAANPQLHAHDTLTFNN